MCKVMIKTLNKNLSCSICGNEEFSHDEVELKITKFRESYYVDQFRDGYEERYIEKFSCNDCGWTAFMENKYSFSLNSYILEVSKH